VSESRFQHQLTELRVTFSLGPMDRPGEVSLATVGVLTEEDLGSPGSTSPSLEVAAHLR